ncbi:MAG: DNA polymerase III subunit beta [Lactobacillus sp.]|nr:DNA polymerase III subunit beta [Lactobacillus sp.]
MKFTINRNLFINNLTNVMRAISSRATIPILNGIKLVLTDDALTLTGSDTDISIELKIPASDDLRIETPGTIVLNARFFSEIIKKLPGKEFSFNVLDGFQTKISSETSEFTINGLDANSYPRLPEVSDDKAFNLPGRTLREIIDETVFAVATSESRVMLTGVRFNFASDKIKAIATDSHRLSQRAISLEKGPEVETDLIIPGKSLQELSRIIGETDPDIRICPGESQVLFEIGNLSFYSRLLEGNYPDTSRLLPDSSTTQVNFSLAGLLSALDRASLLTHAGRNNVVKLNLNVTEQKVVISGESPEIGNVEENLAFTNLSGEDLVISFNPDYLRDALRASVTSEIEMKFTESLRPFTVTPNKAEIDFVQLITPVRTF